MTSELTPYEGTDVTPYAEPVPSPEHDRARYQEEESSFDLQMVWGFARRNWWMVLGGALLGMACAMLYNHHAHPVYQASAIIDLESQTAVPTEFAVLPTTSPLATDMVVLKSRTLAEDVVDSLGLQIQITRPRGVRRDQIFATTQVSREAHPGSYLLEQRDGGVFELSEGDGRRLRDVRVGEPFSIDGALLTLTPASGRHGNIAFSVLDFRGTVGRVSGRVEVAVPGRDARAQVIQVGYTDGDPELAAQVPNALVRRFIEYRRHKQKQSAIATVEFLKDQVDSLNSQLREAEMRVRKYQEATQTIDLLSETGAAISQQASLQLARDTYIMERDAILDVRSRLQARDTTDPLAPSPYRRLIGFPGLASALATPLSTLTAREDERALLLRRRTADDPDVRVITDQIRDTEKELKAQTDAYLLTLESQLRSQDPVVERNRAELAAIPRKAFDLAGLQRTTEVLVTTAAMLQASLKEAEINKAVDDPRVTVIDTAQVPRSPIRPRRMWNLMLGVLLGLGLGVGVAYSRELLDTRVHTREDLRQLTGVPVLGLIPRFDVPARLSLPTRRLFRSGESPGKLAAAQALKPRLVAEIDRSSAVSEAFRSLRTNITFSSTAERVSKVLVLTSPTPQDGKTTTAANLAVTFAQQGLRVALADADMRRGLLHKLFGVSRTPGLSNILVENVDIERAMHRVQLEQGSEIDILPTGTVPPNPAELLSSPRMRWLIARLEERYDAIIFDTPPLTLVTDAAILASRAHTVLLVARANQTEEGAVHFAIEQLRNVGAPVRGTILNDVDYRRDGYGGKYNYNAYSSAYESQSEE